MKKIKLKNVIINCEYITKVVINKVCGLESIEIYLGHNNSYERIFPEGNKVVQDLFEKIDDFLESEDLRLDLTNLKNE